MPDELRMVFGDGRIVNDEMVIEGLAHGDHGAIEDERDLLATVWQYLHQMRLMHARG